MNETKCTAFSTPVRCESLQHRLATHSLYESINNTANLRIFMQHHVFAVWDFMSLIKSLQQHFTSTTLPWVPPDNSRYANFINQLVLEEESDYALSNPDSTEYASHFESYLEAMDEIGADTVPITTFIKIVKTNGLNNALEHPCVPEPAKKFMRFTFDAIAHNKPYVTAATLAYGREDLVPLLFQCIEEKIQISDAEAPKLYAYLQRHIQLDAEEHGPMAKQLLEELCKDSEQNYFDAMQIAEQALEARLEFWDAIHSDLVH